jgi:hypothetical protein
MRQLKHQVHLKQQAVLHDRALLVASTQTLRARALRALATPKALAASFGIGFAAALLRGRSHGHAHGAVEPSGHSGQWLHLLLRDVVMPIALGALQGRMTAGQEQPQDDVA